MLEFTLKDCWEFRSPSPMLKDDIWIGDPDYLFSFAIADDSIYKKVKTFQNPSNGIVVQLENKQSRFPLTNEVFNFVIFKINKCKKTPYECKIKKYNTLGKVTTQSGLIAIVHKNLWTKIEQYRSYHFERGIVVPGMKGILKINDGDLVCYHKQAFLSIKTSPVENEWINIEKEEYQQKKLTSSF